MGFSILLETSAGASAGFSDEDYTRRGAGHMGHMGHQVGSGADESQPVKNHCIFLYWFESCKSIYIDLCCIFATFFVSGSMRYTSGGKRNTSQSWM